MVQNFLEGLEIIAYRGAGGRTGAQAGAGPWPPGPPKSMKINENRLKPMKVNEYDFGHPKGSQMKSKT